MLTQYFINVIKNYSGKEFKKVFNLIIAQSAQAILDNQSLNFQIDFLNEKESVLQAFLDTYKVEHTKADGSKIDNEVSYNFFDYMFKSTSLIAQKEEKNENNSKIGLLDIFKSSYRKLISELSFQQAEFKKAEKELQSMKNEVTKLEKSKDKTKDEVLSKLKKDVEDKEKALYAIENEIKSIENCISMFVGKIAAQIKVVPDEIDRKIVSDCVKEFAFFAIEKQQPKILDRILNLKQIDWPDAFSSNTEIAHPLDAVIMYGDAKCLQTVLRNFNNKYALNTALEYVYTIRLPSALSKKEDAQQIFEVIDVLLSEGADSDITINQKQESNKQADASTERSLVQLAFSYLNIDAFYLLIKHGANFEQFLLPKVKPSTSIFDGITDLAGSVTDKVGKLFKKDDPKGKQKVDSEDKIIEIEEPKTDWQGALLDTKTMSSYVESLIKQNFHPVIYRNIESKKYYEFVSFVVAVLKLCVVGKCFDEPTAIVKDELLVNQTVLNRVTEVYKAIAEIEKNNDFKYLCTATAPTFLQEFFVTAKEYIIDGNRTNNKFVQNIVDSLAVKTDVVNTFSMLLTVAAELKLNPVDTQKAINGIFDVADEEEPILSSSSSISNSNSIHSSSVEINQEKEAVNPGTILQGLYQAWFALQHGSVTHLYRALVKVGNQDEGKYLKHFLETQGQNFFGSVDLKFIKMLITLPGFDNKKQHAENLECLASVTKLSKVSSDAEKYEYEMIQAQLVVPMYGTNKQGFSALYSVGQFMEGYIKACTGNDYPKFKLVTQFVKDYNQTLAGYRKAAGPVHEQIKADAKKAAAEAKIAAEREVAARDAETKALKEAAAKAVEAETKQKAEQKKNSKEEPNDLLLNDKKEDSGFLSSLSFSSLKSSVLNSAFVSKIRGKSTDSSILIVSADGSNNNSNKDTNGQDNDKNHDVIPQHDVNDDLDFSGMMDIEPIENDGSDDEEDVVDTTTTIQAPKQQQQTTQPVVEKKDEKKDVVVTTTAPASTAKQPAPQPVVEKKDEKKDVVVTTTASTAKQPAPQPVVTEKKKEEKVVDTTTTTQAPKQQQQTTQPVVEKKDEKKDVVTTTAPASTAKQPAPKPVVIEKKKEDALVTSNTGKKETAPMTPTKVAPPKTGVTATTGNGKTMGAPRGILLGPDSPINNGANKNGNNNHQPPLVQQEPEQTSGGTTPGLVNGSNSNG